MQRNNKLDFSDLDEPKKLDFSDLGESTAAPKEEQSILLEALANSMPGKMVKAGGILGSDILSGLKSGATTAIKGTPSALEQIKTQPGRALRNVGAGALELGRDILNIPHGLPEFMAHLGLVDREGAQSISQNIPAVPEISERLDKFVGKGKTSGDELIRGLVRNLPGVTGTGAIAKALVTSPLKVTAKNIAKNVVKAEEKQKGVHSSQYGNLWQEADKKGLNKVNYNPRAIDLDAIKKYTPERYYGALEKFLKNPVLENAQKAQSDLGKLERQLEKKTSLTSEEKATLNAAKAAKQHITDNMFKDGKGIVDKKLKDKYEEITKSYRENVVPYTTNKAIQDYKRGELTAKELLQKISKGKFRAKKGAQHPAIKARELSADLAKILGISGGITGGIAGGTYLINKLLGKGND